MVMLIMELLTISVHTLGVLPVCPETMGKVGFSFISSCRAIEDFLGHLIPLWGISSLYPLLSFLLFFFVFVFFFRKISPELTSAANPPLFAEEGWP